MYFQAVRCNHVSYTESLYQFDLPWILYVHLGNVSENLMLCYVYYSFRDIADGKLPYAAEDDVEEEVSDLDEDDVEMAVQRLAEFTEKIQEENQGLFTVMWHTESILKLVVWVLKSTCCICLCLLFRYYCQKSICNF